MDGQNYLGTYISKNTATVVCLGSGGKGAKILGCFSVSVEETEREEGISLFGLCLKYINKMSENKYE